MTYTQIENLLSFNMIFIVKDTSVLTNSNSVDYIMEKYHKMVGVKPNTEKSIEYTVGFDNHFEKYLKSWRLDKSSVSCVLSRDIVYNYEEIKRVYFYLYRIARLNTYKKYYPNLILKCFNDIIGDIHSIYDTPRTDFVHVLLRDLVQKYINYHSRYIKSFLIVGEL